MANTSRIRGFQPAKSLTGAPWQSLVRQYDADDARANAIFIGDAVVLDADGNVSQAATGGTFLGVVVAVGKDTTTFGVTGYFNPDDLGQRYLPANQSGVVGVVPAEAALFNVFSTLAADLDLNVGDTADIVPGTGSVITGNSNMTINLPSTNSDVKVVEQNTAPDNDPTLADAQFIVKFQTTENSL